MPLLTLVWREGDPAPVMVASIEPALMDKKMRTLPSQCVRSGHCGVAHTWKFVHKALRDADHAEGGAVRAVADGAASA